MAKPKNIKNPMEGLFTSSVILQPSSVLTDDSAVTIVDSSPMVVPSSAPATDRKSDSKAVPVTIYLPPLLSDHLSDQVGRTRKEKNRSALVCAGLDIVLTISFENYSKLKAVAAAENVTPGEYINNLIEKA